MLTLRPSKRAGRPYHGRLAYDSDSGFHIDPKGRRVITEDGGKTWVYAGRKSLSHFARYHRAFKEMEGTETKLARMALERGPERARESLRESDPHHFEDNPSPAPQLPDAEAPTVTSHTDAWS